MFVTLLLLLFNCGILINAEPNLHWIDVEKCGKTCSYTGRIIDIGDDFIIPIQHNDTNLFGVIKMVTTHAFHRHNLELLYEFTQPQITDGPCAVTDLCLSNNKPIRPGKNYSVYNVTSVDRHHLVDLYFNDSLIVTIDVPEGAYSSVNGFTIDSYSTFQLDPVHDLGTLLVIPKNIPNPVPMICTTNGLNEYVSSSVGLVKINSYGQITTNLTLLQDAYVPNTGAAITYNGLHFTDPGMSTTTWQPFAGRVVQSSTSYVTQTMGTITFNYTAGYYYLYNIGNIDADVILHEAVFGRTVVVKVPATSRVQFDYAAEELWCFSKWNFCVKVNNRVANYVGGSIMHFWTPLYVVLPVDLTMQPRYVNFQVNGNYTTNRGGVGTWALYAQVSLIAKTLDGNLFRYDWPNIGVINFPVGAFSLSQSLALGNLNNKFPTDINWNMTSTGNMTIIPDNATLEFNTYRPSFTISTVDSIGTTSICKTFATGATISAYKLFRANINLYYTTMTNPPTFTVTYTGSNGTLTRVIWTAGIQVTADFDFNLDFLTGDNATFCINLNTTGNTGLFLQVSQISYYWLGVDYPVFDANAHLEVNFYSNPLSLGEYSIVTVNSANIQVYPFSTHGGVIDTFTPMSTCSTVSTRLNGRVGATVISGDDQLSHLEYSTTNKRYVSNTVDVGVRRYTLDFEGFEVINNSNYTSCATHLSDTIVILSDIMTITSVFYESCNSSELLISYHTAPDSLVAFKNPYTVITKTHDVVKIETTVVLPTKSDFTLIGVADFGIGDPLVWQTRVYRNVTDPCRWFCDVPYVSESSPIMKTIFGLGISGVVLAGLAVCSGPLIAVGTTLLAFCYYSFGIFRFLWNGLMWIGGYLTAASKYVLSKLFGKWRDEWNKIRKQQPKAKKNKGKTKKDIEKGERSDVASIVPKRVISVTSILALMLPTTLATPACVNSALSVANVTTCVSGTCGASLLTSGTVALIPDSEFCVQYTSVSTNLGDQIVKEFGVRVHIKDVTYTYPLKMEYYTGPTTVQTKIICECPTGKTHYCNNDLHPSALDCAGICTYIADNNGPKTGCGLLIGPGHYCASLTPVTTVDYPIFSIGGEPSCLANMEILVDGAVPATIPFEWDCYSDKTIKFGTRSSLVIHGQLNSFKDYSIDGYLVRSKSNGWFIRDMNPVGQYDLNLPGWLQKPFAGSPVPAFNPYSLQSAFQITGKSCGDSQADINGEYSDLSKYLINDNKVSNYFAQLGNPTLIGYDNDTSLTLTPFSGADILFTLLTDSTTVKFDVDNSCPKITKIDQSLIYQDGTIGHILVTAVSTCGSGAASISVYDIKDQLLGTCNMVLTTADKTCTVPFNTLSYDPTVIVVIESYFNSINSTFNIQTNEHSFFVGDVTVDIDANKTASDSCWWCLPTNASLTSPWSNSFIFAWLKICVYAIVGIILIYVIWRIIKCATARNSHSKTN